MELVRYPSPIEGKQDVEVEPELKSLKKRISDHDKILSKLSQDVVDIRTENREIKKLTVNNLSATKCVYKFGLILILLGTAQMAATIWWASRTEAALIAISNRLSRVEKNVAQAPDPENFSVAAISYIQQLF